MHLRAEVSLDMCIKFRWFMKTIFYRSRGGKEIKVCVVQDLIDA